jgi:dipeptidyl aminopeptidase/acylaminoacyl peptidase
VTRWREPAPGEREAGERSWEVVREAFEERIVSARPRNWRPVVAVAIGVAILAAAFTPPGLAVWSSLRDAVRNEDHLLSLPTRGRVLVNASAGAWVVNRDGSKRLLSGYTDAAWSPHGLYIAAARGNQLVALEPNGRVHWKLARSHPIGGPRWSYDGYRIAYLAGHALRVVNGDGTGDRLLSPNGVGSVLPAFSWRPGTHELAYRNGRNQLVLLDVDGGRVLWSRPTKGIEQLLWSGDGRRLLVADGTPRLLDALGRTIASLPRRQILPAAFAPKSRSLAVVISANGGSTVYLYSGESYDRRRIVFSAPGSFGGLAWSPDRRWLLVDLRSADQWLFIRSGAVRRIAVRNIGNTFDSGPEHYAVLAGWCCP